MCKKQKQLDSSTHFLLLIQVRVVGVGGLEGERQGAPRTCRQPVAGQLNSYSSWVFKCLFWWLIPSLCPESVLCFPALLKRFKSADEVTGGVKRLLTCRPFCTDADDDVFIFLNPCDRRDPWVIMIGCLMQGVRTARYLTTEGSCTDVCLSFSWLCFFFSVFSNFQNTNSDLYLYRWVNVLGFHVKSHKVDLFSSVIVGSY